MKLGKHHMTQEVTSNSSRRQLAGPDCMARARQEVAEPVHVYYEMVAPISLKPGDDGWHTWGQPRKLSMPHNKRTPLHLSQFQRRASIGLSGKPHCDPTDRFPRVSRLNCLGRESPAVDTLT